jgi:hypothetical protein
LAALGRGGGRGRLSGLRVARLVVVEAPGGNLGRALVKGRSAVGVGWWLSCGS